MALHSSIMNLSRNQSINIEVDLGLKGIALWFFLKKTQVKHFQ